MVCFRAARPCFAWPCRMSSPARKPRFALAYAPAFVTTIVTRKWLVTSLLLPTVIPPAFPLSATAPDDSVTTRVVASEGDAEVPPGREGRTGRRTLPACRAAGTGRTADGARDHGRPRRPHGTQPSLDDVRRVRLRRARRLPRRDRRLRPARELERGTARALRRPRRARGRSRSAPCTAACARGATARSRASR